MLSEAEAGCVMREEADAENGDLLMEMNLNAKMKVIIMEMHLKTKR